ncbi:Histone promoter control 2 (HPC2) [Metarhizium album ARSEF 1941]|uniref:Histone promoter control 2 (HPC2) n=1 Tax=Metarhizium album (strain ARSEF 1941) TaxID=1081103 RepID=A0A0B2X3X4_METAS|nr:Histone promoter control 2 (HPC2) [Metarhizium album ARSEF 1941]KHO01059.1 Histone promoter control 2 (HPC2) [Metarhizium album ARSEF 1941]
MDKDREQIVVGSDQSPGQRQLTFQSYQQPSPSGGAASARTPSQKRYELIDGQWVQLTAAGLPRKKPGRKPGSTVKTKLTDGADPSKARKPRKPRDSNALPVQRKRKTAPGSDADGDSDVSRSASGHHAGTSSPSQQHQLLGPPDLRGSPKMPKREGYPGSMQSILNADPPSASIPVRSSGLSYDPIRGNYDPIRETITPHNTNPYSSTSGSPRGPAQAANRSPSIASIIEPQPRTATSPSLSQRGHSTASAHSRHHGREPSSMPPSPSYRPTSTLGAQLTAVDLKKASTVAAAQRPVVNQANFTTISNGPVRRCSPKLKPATGVSTPRTDALDDFQDSEGRSILDFGKARPGEEFQAPTIVLNIPIVAGETNKYVNFMRLAEDRYGWDALHPRQAANRDRKARIEAAAASLEKAELGRESGDEMSLDNSDGEASNPENGGTSGPDAPVKPKKKRNFKEDQYDVDDDFVDDSELLWEAQAAASRDGFFVYSGPLVPEVEKPAIPHERPKRGRGSRGARGSRGSARGGTGAGRGGGPGSRGGTVTRKPRVTKAERLQREREKAERESMAQISNKTQTNGYVLQPSTPAFSVSELGA